MECQMEVRNGTRDKDNAGVYIGESSRSLAERAIEYVMDSRVLDKETLTTKHWALQHSDRLSSPRSNCKLLL